MPFLSSFDEHATQVQVFERWPELAVHLKNLAQQLLREGPFSAAQAELIFTYTSGVNACRYCYGIHKHTAEKLGVAAGLLEALLEDVDTAPIDEKMKPVLHFVRKLTESPATMTQADADAIVQAGWDDNAFQYAISICAFANYLNRILAGHGIEATPEYWRESGERLSKQPYNIS